MVSPTARRPSPLPRNLFFSVFLALFFRSLGTYFKQISKLTNVCIQGKKFQMNPQANSKFMLWLTNDGHYYPCRTSESIFFNQGSGTEASRNVLGFHWGGPTDLLCIDVKHFVGPNFKMQFKISKNTQSRKLPSVRHRRKGIYKNPGLLDQLL